MFIEICFITFLWFVTGHIWLIISTRYKIPSFNTKLIFFHKRKYIGPELPLTDGLLFTTSRGIIFSFTSLMETETFQVK